MTEMNFARKSIQSLLSENSNFAVPAYQRGYAWDNNEWDDFWADLQEVVASKEDDHFLGQVVVNTLDGKAYIVDGQQRVTTVIIMLAVLRDRFAQMTDNAKASVRADDLQSDFIQHGNQYVFTQSEQYAEFFRRLIQVPGNFDEVQGQAKLDSEKNFVKAYKYFDNCISNDYKDRPTEVSRLQYLERQKKMLLEHEFVMLISTSDESSAFIIFETLNARGRDLNSSDLLKNHLFRKAQGDNDIKHHWDQMMDPLGYNSSLATKFIRSYWNATEQFTTEKKLYRALSHKIQTANDARDFVKKLADLSDFYVSMVDPKRESIFTDDTLLKNLYVLNLLGAKTFYPLILVMVDSGKFTEQDIAIVTYKVISFTVRNFTIGGLVANKYEKAFSTIANNLYRGEINTIEEINQAISDQMTSDTQFSDDIRTASITTERAAKYILSELAYPDEVENIDLNDVKVQQLNNNVEDSDRIGNKFLFTKNEERTVRKNSKIRAGIVANSKLQETRPLADLVDTISSEQIDERQNAWAQVAVNVWSKNQS